MFPQVVLFFFLLFYYPDPTKSLWFSSCATHLVLEPIPDDSSPHGSDVYNLKSSVTAVTFTWACHYILPCPLIALHVCTETGSHVCTVSRVRSEVVNTLWLGAMPFTVHC